MSSTNDTPAPAAGGLKSTLKILIPIGVLMAVIFGVTYITQYVPTSDDDKKTGTNTRKEPALRFASSARHWDPPNLDAVSDFGEPYFRLPYRGRPLLAPSAMPTDPDLPFRFSAQDRAFPGFYEVQAGGVGPKHSASFWFENPHEKSVIMQLREVSCSACSGGSLAPIPPEVTKQLLQMSGISALPQGLVTGLPVGMMGPAANLDRLEWQTNSFLMDPHASYKVPPADKTDPWAPQWGILKLEFSVGAVGPKPLTAKFMTAVEGTQQVEANEFTILSEGVNPFDLTVNSIDLGQLTENSEARKFEVVAYSTTRGPNRTGPGELGDLPPPVADVRMPVARGGDPGPFIAIGAPVRVPEADLPNVAREVFEKSKKIVRVEAAYRYPVTMNPRVGDKRIDIGLLEREIWFAVGAKDERGLKITGMVGGAVWLDDNQNEIAMPNYPHSAGGSKTFRILTANRGLDVALVTEDSRPKFLQLSLEKDPKPPSGDRGYYTLKIKVPSRNESTQVKTGSYSGEIVLEVKGSNPQRIRIPIKGRVDPR
jgi:hypothetical protein